MGDLETLTKQLKEEKAMLEEAKKLRDEIEKDVGLLKELLQSEKDTQDTLLDRFEELSRESSASMKENNTKVKKLRDQHKKDMKAQEKKKVDKKKGAKKK